MNTTVIIVHFDLLETKRGLTSNFHSFLLWKAPQYIGLGESDINPAISP
jgi:hypothetical protein